MDMKKMIKKLKDNIETIIVFHIGLIALKFYQNTLVTSYYFYVILFLICIPLYFLLTINFRFKNKIFAYLKLIIYTYVFIMSILYLRLWKYEEQTYQLPLEAYSYGRIDEIYFTFENIYFGKNLTLTNYPGRDGVKKFTEDEDLTKIYDVYLKLENPFKYVYLVDDVYLVRKDNLLIEYRDMALERYLLKIIFFIVIYIVALRSLISW